MNPGKNTIDWLKNEQLHIDPEWMIETPKGLTWWPGRHAQHIEVVGREKLSESSPRLPFPASPWTQALKWSPRLRKTIKTVVRQAEALAAEVKEKKERQGEHYE